tara:strand:- start:37 stop:168 length:132 start_codon:yes stop_codon:yes gene_type:complete
MLAKCKFLIRISKLEKSLQALGKVQPYYFFLKEILIGTPLNSK